MANLKAVLQRPKVSASYQRNAFDRSFTPNFHYQLGGLQPFMAEPVIAGSHMKLNRSIFQRTAAVNTAAFPKVDTHCEFFYVPLRLLWSYWNDFKLNIQDYNSSYQVNWDNAGTVTAHNPILVPSFDLRNLQNEIVGWLSGHFNAAQPSAHFALKSQALGANRLLDQLGYGCTFSYQSWQDPATSPLSNFRVNAFKLLAYQKVYYDHFRNTAYESNDPSAYNADGTFTPNAAFDDAILKKILTYRYVNYRKDYFQSIYPALNYTISSPSGPQWQVPSSVQYNMPYGSQSVNAYTGSAGQTFLSNSPDSTTGVSYTTVQQIRASFALDKLLRASAYAPKHVKDQFEARYGVKGVETGNESIRIGAYMNDIIIQEVTSLADTSTGNNPSNLGEIGGKGVGYDAFGKDIEFTAKEDGIILGLCYSMPRTSYDSLRIDNWNVKDTREDFFIPEFMDLGMQPMYRYEGFWTHIALPSTMNDLIGYKDRYSEYKVGIDQNHGLFNLNNQLSDFVVHSNRSYLASYSGTGVDVSYFKVKPTDMDPVFVQGTSVDDWNTDKFITHLNVKFIVNQNMSIHGQPRLGGLV